MKKFLKRHMREFWQDLKKTSRMFVVLMILYSVLFFVFSQLPSAMQFEIRSALVRAGNYLSSSQTNQSVDLFLHFCFKIIFLFFAWELCWSFMIITVTAIRKNVASKKADGEVKVKRDFKYLDMAVCAIVALLIVNNIHALDVLAEKAASFFVR